MVWMGSDWISGVLLLYTVDDIGYMERMIALMPGEGKSISLFGVTITYKALRADTQGAWSLIEYAAPPQFTGPQPHWHRRTVEAFYVLDGTVTFQVGDRSHRAPAGSFLMIPTGVVHTFSNPEESPAKFLTLVAPGGLERYFEELALIARSEVHWPPSDPQTLNALGAKYDIHTPPAQW
jgi:mannose-6-phosphate isomerase-like protein (cupin superfamily)